MSSFNAGLIQAYDKDTEKRLTRWAGFYGPTGVLELEDGSVLVGEVGTGKLLRVSGAEGPPTPPLRPTTSPRSDA